MEGRLSSGKPSVVLQEKISEMMLEVYAHRAMVRAARSA